jgi:hypothetical protein
MASISGVTSVGWVSIPPLQAACGSESNIFTDETADLRPTNAAVRHNPHVLAHGAVSPLEANVGEGRQHFQARMVGGEIFSETQGPKDLQNRNQRTQRLSLVIGWNH